MCHSFVLAPTVCPLHPLSVHISPQPPTLYPLHCLGVLRSVLDAAVEGCNVLTLCEMGDRLILEETSKVYKREKEMKKGKF